MSCDNCNCCDEADEVEEVYEEFVPYKEYPVGGFFKIGREVFKVVEQTGCTRCEFDNIDCMNLICVDEDRSDANSVIFILYDTLDETEYET